MQFKIVRDVPKPDKKLKDVDITGKKRVHETKISPEKFYYEAEPFTSQYGLTKAQIRKQKQFMKKHMGAVVLVKMELANGQFREFLVYEKDFGFIFRNKRYIFDLSMRYFLIERNIYAYDFHEHLSIPLRKRYEITPELERLLIPVIDKEKKKPLKPHIKVEEIKKLIENSQVIDVEASLNPSTLKRFTDSEVIKQVLQGAMLGRVFKIMFVLIIIIAIFMMILILIQLYSSGIFEAVGSYFK